MGSKSKLLPSIEKIVLELNPKTALDAFSGSGCVSYLLKDMGVNVTTNDFLKFAGNIGKAVIENNETKISEEDIEFLINNNSGNHSFIQDTFKGLYYNDEDNKFLDDLWFNIDRIENEYKKAIAFASISRACIKRRPRGMFAYTGFRYEDGRKDLKLSLKEHFILAIQEWNNAIFDNKTDCKAINQDIFDVTETKFDLVYIDPPYVSTQSDNDYTRRYHFIEGYMSYWKGVNIQQHTKTKKIESKYTPFGSKKTIYKAFDDIFKKFRNSTLLVSYSSNSIPSREEMVELLKTYKKDVSIIEVDYKYSFGNHAHKVGNNRNAVSEYLFIAK